MRALAVTPGKPDSLDLIDIEDPDPGPDELLVDGLAVGICGTDEELVAGKYGTAPADRDQLVIGHESLGRVADAPKDSGFDQGDLVVGVVRRPDPEPCGACAHGEFDMCRNGRYTERGIKGLDGYASRQWSVETGYGVKLDPRLIDVGVLLEPTAIVTKAWAQIDHVGARSWFEPRCVLVTGAGPIGLLAAMLGVQRGLDVHVLDQVSTGPKPRLVAEVGATYHDQDVADVAEEIQPDIVLEATGAEPVVLETMTITRPYGIVCLTGFSSGGSKLKTDLGAVNREIVMENDVVIGSVNANCDHFRSAADALAKADTDWLSGLISRRVPMTHFAEAFAPRDDDVKVVIGLED